MPAEDALFDGERARLERALAESERRYRELFEEDTSGRFVVTPEWQLLQCNATFAHTLGHAAPGALVGRNLLSLSPDSPVLQKLLAITRVEGKAGPAELRLERADGELIDISCVVAGSRDQSGALIELRGQVVEVTERKRLETRLVGAERMEAIGRLAGGLAHDFNNLLTVISGNSERLLETMSDPGPLNSAVRAIQDATVRAASMTRQLLAYSRRQVFELQPLALHRLVADVQPQLAAVLGDAITIRLAVPADVPSISADARQIEHVLVTLATNAREAMPSGGTCTIKVDTLAVGESAPRDRLWLRPGSYVRLTVSDTGHGMDPATRAYAFQPFFTTRKMGNGRGLGLATVYGIVKQSHGFVWVESEPDRGATFTLLFPAIRSVRNGTTSGGQTLATETILVVEGDAQLRGFIGAALERRGYRVLEAGSAAEGIERFASHPSRIHLLLLAGGSETPEAPPLQERLKAIDPQVQVLAVHDGGATGDSRHPVLPMTPALQAPFTLRELADKVREVLDSGEGR